MTECVTWEQMQEVFGIPRLDHVHVAKAVSDEQVLYILHSQDCLDRTEDLRTCPYAEAQNQGVDEAAWEPYLDKIVVVALMQNWTGPRPSPFQDAAWRVPLREYEPIPEAAEE